MCAVGLNGVRSAVQFTAKSNSRQSAINHSGNLVFVSTERGEQGKPKLIASQPSFQFLCPSDRAVCMCTLSAFHNSYVVAAAVGIGEVNYYTCQTQLIPIGICMSPAFPQLTLSSLSPLFTLSSIPSLHKSSTFCCYSPAGFLSLPGMQTWRLH